MDTPLVTIVLPVRNEEDHLAECLEAILSQDYPPDRLEVVVVDGDSDDGTIAIVARYAERDPRVRLGRNPRRIVPSSMNVGIRMSRGDIVARVDGHTRIAPDYVRTGVETLERTGADNVGGPMHAVGGGWFGDAAAAATSSRFGVGSYFHFGTEEREVDTVYLGMWPREVFERVGLFDEDLVRNQDDELNYRLRKAGGRIVMNPAMRSRYQNRQSLRGLARQYYQYGLWKVRVLQKHPLQMSWRHFVPPTFVAALAVLTAACPFSRSASRLAGGIAALYGAAVLSVSSVQARGPRSWLAVSLAFVTIHLAWGLGFLGGLVRFAGGWGRQEAPPRLARRGDGALPDPEQAHSAVWPGGRSV